jgi:hypothetical protein
VAERALQLGKRYLALRAWKEAGDSERVAELEKVLQGEGWLAGF